MPSVSHVRSPEAWRRDFDRGVLWAGFGGGGAARRVQARSSPIFSTMWIRAASAPRTALSKAISKPVYREAALHSRARNLGRGNETPCGFVYGAGFEDRPELLDEIARRFPLVRQFAGCGARGKGSAAAFAALCASLNIPHPEISPDLPSDTAELARQKHRRSWGKPCRAGRRHLAARARRHLFSAHRAGTILFRSCFSPMEPMRKSVGLSRQWAAPTPRMSPSVLAAAFALPSLSPELEGQLAARGGNHHGRACGLRGLNSIDFLVDGDSFTLIEINPRPGATLDIFEDRDGTLFPRPSRCLSRPPARTPACIRWRRGGGNRLCAARRLPACRNSTGPIGRRTGRKPQSALRRA